MMVRNLFLSTILTAAVSLSATASAEQVVNATAKTVKHKKVTHKDDAYSPKQHHQVAVVEQKPETMVVFTEVREQKQHKEELSEGLSVKVGGKVDIQHGFISQKDFFKNPSNNENLRQYEDIDSEVMSTAGKSFTNQDAMVSNGELSFKAEKKVDDCQKYGLEIVTNANTSPASSGSANFASKVFIYMENPAGRFEVGANDGVNSTMGFSAAKIAKATGGIDGDFSGWVPYVAIAEGTNISLQDTYLTTPALPYSAYNQKKANKITYYTPTYNGFKAGLSYIRDATVQGTIYEALSFKGSGFKNVFEAGLSYENSFNSMTLGLSLNGQIGESRPAYIDQTKTHDLKKLGAWEVGGKVSYDSVTVAASYGDWDKSGTIKNPPADTPSRKANFWTAGLAYDYQDKGGMSVTYMHSERRGAFALGSYKYTSGNQAKFDAATQKYDAVSVGGEYKVMEGLMPYAEFTSFKYKTTLADVKVNDGSVVLAGVKLNF